MKSIIYRFAYSEGFVNKVIKITIIILNLIPTSFVTSFPNFILHTNEISLQKIRPVLKKHVVLFLFVFKMTKHDLIFKLFCGKRHLGLILLFSHLILLQTFCY